MVESTEVPKSENKINTKELLGDVFYGTVKGIGGLALKLFTNLEIEGKENIPLRGKAILTTISKNVIRDLLIISQVSGRKIHFMLSPKLMRHQIAGPVLKSLGMIRSTESKEDTEPIDNVFRILNEEGDLVAMTPEAKLDRETKIKSLAAIIKFAVAADAPIIPIAVVRNKTKLFNMVNFNGFKVKVGNPLPMDKKLNRDKYRSQRYEIAEDILNIIESLEEEEMEEENNI
ncbi:MAG: lysophospholipid acyltransferase family protein [Promethearchaeota archaeon]